MRKSLLSFFALAAIYACGAKPEPEGPDPNVPQTQTVSFSHDLTSSPICAVDGGWKTGTQIMLIIGGKPTGFDISSTSSAGTTTVKGKKTSSTDVYAAYPYGKGVEFLGTSIGATVPATQSGKAPESISYSAAKLNTAKVQMKDMSARVSFSLGENSFTSLKVTASGGAMLAGKVKISFPSGQDVSYKTEGASASVTFSPGDNGLFAAGEYSLVCLNLPDNTTLTFEAGDIAMHTYVAEVDNCGLGFGEIKNLNTIEFKDQGSTTPSKDIDMDEIPDFSRVGYHYGDMAIPEIAVNMTLEAPKDGSDATELIQNAINKVQTPGCILLKAGTYNIGGELKIQRSGVVLRGEGAGTILFSTAKTQQTALITLGQSASRALSTYSEITEAYTPCGIMSVKVANPSSFKRGDVVFLFRPGTAKWISDLHMNELPARSDGGSVSQWTASGFNMYWERIVTEVKDGRVYLDNPVVMGIGGEGYGIGRLYHGSYSRIEECGIENMTLESQYDASIKNGKDFTDENHCWSAIRILAAKNCWVRGINTRHFGNSGVLLDTGAKWVTVEDCHVYAPVSVVTGGRRYAFNMNDPQQCLVKDCSCDDDRHQYVLGSRVAGPNVFLRCTGTNSRSEAGPHHRWSTGTLFDNVKVSTQFNLHDRHNAGSGQGWACANTVMYNCTAATIVCQSPWVSAQNWAIGCIGQKKATAITYQDNLGARPDGTWISPGTKATPESLYESQIADRHAKGIWLNDLK